MKLRIKFSKSFRREFCILERQYPKLAGRVRILNDAAATVPSSGIGNPHAYTKNPKCWAREITGKHRLVYIVDNGVVEFIGCLGHYDDH
jgi:Txe/YoeB family toxin of Txe-Axe toxin-antitoxin module